MLKIVPVILCGGSGERLWPMSNAQKPKQFLKILSEYTLLQETVMRLSAITEYDISDVVIVTLMQWKEEAHSQITSIDIPYKMHYLCEPVGKGTLPAISLASLYVQKNFGSETLSWILPSDHHIENPELLAQVLDKAVKPAQNGYFTTIGIKPLVAETAYGYLQIKNSLPYCSIYEVGRFVEKPELDMATMFIESGDYLWSSGMHLIENESLVDLLKEFAPETMDAIYIEGNLNAPKPNCYQILKKQSFEKEVLEKMSKLAVVEAGFSWSDIGRWRTIWDAAPKNDDGNVLRGNVFCDDVQNSLIFGGSRGISCVGLKNAVVIENEEGILVASIDTAYRRGNK